MALTPKQALFVKEYLIDLNATQAAIRAGYSFPVKGDAYYVYFLADPQNGKIFYVGKGSGKRVHTHVKNAEKGKIDNAAKHEAIATVLARGQKPLEVIFSNSPHEIDSYSLEYELIKQLRSHGIHNIANGFQDNRKIKIVKFKDMLSRLRSFEDWSLVCPCDARSYVMKNGGSMEAYYQRFKLSILNAIIHEANYADA